MPKRTKALAVLSVGAVALASTAYAIGSTAGSGSATAAGTKSAKRTPLKTSATDPWVVTLAGKLGVDPSALAGALDAARAAQTPPSKDDELAKLADALGVPKADLQKALDTLRPQRPNRPSPPKPPNGNARPKLPGAPGAPHFRERRGHGGPGGPGFGFGGPGLGGPGIPDQLADALAKALKIDKSKVTAAFDKLRTQRQADEQTRWDAYVKALADKLSLPVDKVEQGLGSVPPRGFGGFEHP
jgi:3D (Asp-Asp-Asp) domain-containing protein